MAESETGRPMDGKVCIVTGATAGIGLVAASELARRGARVIGVGRSQERCGEAARLIRDQTNGASVEYLVADLSSQSEIRRLAQGVKASTGRLDVLLNNAGGIYLERQETTDGIERTFALNHLAYFLLTNLLLDLLKASAPARIINVSSAAHKGSKINFDDLQGKTRYSGWRAYQQSKLANILFTRELARRLSGTGVTVNALHPGFVNTKIFRAEGFIGWLLRRSADLMAISPDEGAKTSVYLATSPEVENVTGKYFVKQHIAPSSAASQDDAAARRLWEVSEKLTGLPASSAV
jgi:retinol dehydrogenase-12